MGPGIHVYSRCLVHTHSAPMRGWIGHPRMFIYQPPQSVFCGSPLLHPGVVKVEDEDVLGAYARELVHRIRHP